jgi:hypothetical protein
MRFKVNDIVHGMIPISTADVLRDKNVEMRFVGKIITLNEEEFSYVMHPYVCSDMYGGWHALSDHINEAEDFVEGLCSSEQFDLFHDRSKDSSKWISEEQYFDKVAKAIVEELFNNMTH